MTWFLASLAVLAAAAAAAAVLARAPRVALGVAMAGVAAAGVLATVAAGAVLLGGPAPPQACSWPLPLGTVRLELDALSAWFLMTTAVVAASVAIYSVAYVRPLAGLGPGAFGVLLCALTASLFVVIGAADAILFLAGWEAMTLTAFLLIAFHHDQPEVRRGAWMYLVVTHVATILFLVPLFAVLIVRGGTTECGAFASAARAMPPSLLAALFLMGLAGFGTKAGFMPVHVWLPAAHPVAPTPVSALLSGVVVKAGIYGLLRLLHWLGPLPAYCGEIVLVVGAVSGVMGVLHALAQHDLKRLLAYHTVENIGIIALGIGAGMLGQATGQPALAVLGYAGALLHVTNHALFKGLLFLSAGAVLHGAGTVDIERLGGLARRTPANAFLFLIGAVAICGLPPLNGFVSEWITFGSLFGGTMRGRGAAAAAPALGLVALALMGGLALARFAKVFGVVFLGNPRDPRTAAHATPPLMVAGMAILALGCVLIGIMPGAWVAMAERAALGMARLDPALRGDEALRGVLAPAGALSGAAAVLAGSVGALWALRRVALARSARRGAAQAPQPTWGCGYAWPTPRMQYTASSFAASLIAGFRALLWPRRHFDAPRGVFPGGGRLETHTTDVAEHDLFEPLERGIARGLAMLRTVSWSGRGVPEHAGAAAGHGPARTLLARLAGALRRSSIQMRLAFIVVTLVILLLVEALSSGGAGARAAPRGAARRAGGGAAVSVLRAILEALLLLALPPFLLSVIAKTKAWFGGRVGPPWLQPYYDLHKLMRKSPVYSRTTTWVFRAGPIVSLAALLTAATLVPVFSGNALMGFQGDVILVACLLALARMFTVLAAMDTGSSFEGMGAAREATFGTMSEPALFLALLVLALSTGSLQLSRMVGPELAAEWRIAAPAMVLVVGALLLVLLTETCRVPVDDPATHLELTMIHEVMVLDHSGPDFAYITYGAALKFTLLGGLLLHAAVPHAEALRPVDPLLRAGELALLAAGVGVVESMTARLRLNRVPLMLAGATVLAVIAVVVVYVRRSA